MTNRIKVLLVDDHQLVRKGIRALLEELDFLEIIGEATNGQEAIDLLRNGAGVRSVAGETNVHNATISWRKLHAAASASLRPLGRFPSNAALAFAI